MRTTFAFFVLVFMSIGGAAAQEVQSQEHRFRVVRVAEGLEHPWGLAFLPDGRMLVTERAGRLRVAGKDGRLEPQPVAGLPQIAEHGQGGLLDVALHPKFAENSLVYLSYAARGVGGVGTEVARGKFVGNRLEKLPSCVPRAVRWLRLR